MSKMAKRKQKRSVKAHKDAEPTVSVIVKPTPETKANLKPNTVSVLFELGRHRGGIDEGQKQAAEEILEVYAAITKARVVSQFDREVVIGGQAGDPLSRLPSRLEERWREHYRPWAAAMSARVVASVRPPHPSQLVLCLDVVADNRTLLECALLRGVGPIAVRNQVVDALEAYCQIAGLAKRTKGC